MRCNRSRQYLAVEKFCACVVVVVVNVNLNQHVTFSQGEDSSTVATQSRLTSEEDITTTAWNRNPDAISSANDILKMHCQGLPLCTVRSIDRSLDEESDKEERIGRKEGAGSRREWKEFRWTLDGDRRFTCWTL